MIHAESREAAEQVCVGFLHNWQLRCKAVSASFAEAGFPISQWKALSATCKTSWSLKVTRYQFPRSLECAVVIALWSDVLVRSGSYTSRNLA
jgi:hypothetical protein